MSRNKVGVVWKDKSDSVPSLSNPNHHLKTVTDLRHIQGLNSFSSHTWLLHFRVFFEAIKINSIKQKSRKTQMGLLNQDLKPWRQVPSSNTKLSTQNPQHAYQAGSNTLQLQLGIQMKFACFTIKERWCLTLAYKKGGCLTPRGCRLASCLENRELDELGIIVEGFIYCPPVIGSVVPVLAVILVHGNATLIIS